MNGKHNSRVIVVMPYGANQYHFETDLELAQQHLLRGDSVTLLTCTADLTSCDVNLEHDLAQCLNCILRRRRAVRVLRGKPSVEPLLRLEESDRRILESVRTEFTSIEDLRSYTLESFDIGMAVLSSIVSLTRDPQPSMERTAPFVRELLVSSAAIFLSMKRWLTAARYHRVYAYNGRFATMRAVLRACQACGVDCYLHDRGSSFDRYALYENTLPHSLEMTERRIRAAWENAVLSADREAVASRFYKERAQGVSRNWYSFVAGQRQDYLPDSWRSSCRNVVIFTSSEDEFVAIGDQWKNPLYGDQRAGLRQIVEDLRGRAGIFCHVRIHPNARAVGVAAGSGLAALDGGNIRVVPAESAASSYAMLMASDVVLTFGSSMGIEATYWRRVSVLAGQCFYRNLDATHNPENHQEVLYQILHQREPADIRGALMYGYYFATFGQPFEHFRADHIFGGEFEGRRVGPGRIGYRLVRLIGGRYGGFFRLLVRRALESRSKGGLGLNPTRQGRRVG